MDLRDLDAFQFRQVVHDTCAGSILVFHTHHVERDVDAKAYLALTGAHLLSALYSGVVSTHSLGRVFMSCRTSPSPVEVDPFRISSFMNDSMMRIKPVALSVSHLSACRLW